MLSLIVLGTLLLAFWAWGIVFRADRAAFMRDWVHVPLLAAIMIYIMAIVAAFT